MDWSVLRQWLETEGEAESGSNDLFVCLGAGTQQLPLIHAARRLGLRVVAVDRRAGAPGFQHADACLQVGTNRPARIRRILGTQLTGGRVVGVATRSFGPAGVTAAALASSLGRPGPSVASVRLFRNKRRLKELLAENGVVVPRSYGWRNREERMKLMQAPRPLVVRPAGGHAKLGVRILRRSTDVRMFLRDIGHDNASLLVEEFVEGAEVTVLGLIHDGGYLPVSISQKWTAERPLFAEVRHSYPAQVSDVVRTRIQAAMQRLVRAAGLSCGPIVAEFLIDRDGRPILVEASPEVGGECIADCIAEVGAGVPFFESLVRIATGQEPFLGGRRPRSVVIRYLMPEDGRLVGLRVPDSLADHPALLFYQELRTIGSVLSTDRGNLDRPFVFALCAEEGKVEELEEEAERLAREIEVQYEPVEKQRSRRGLGRPLPTKTFASVLPR